MNYIIIFKIFTPAGVMQEAEVAESCIDDVDAIAFWDGVTYQHPSTMTAHRAGYWTEKEEEGYYILLDEFGQDDLAMQYIYDCRHEKGRIIERPTYSIEIMGGYYE